MVIVGRWSDLNVPEQKAKYLSGGRKEWVQAKQVKRGE
jgi:hypothetical protein